MTPARDFCRRRLLLLVVVLAAAAPGALGAEDRAGKGAEKIRLPEAVEKALGELATQAGAIKLELRREDMRKIIAEIVEVTKLGEDGRKQLEAAARGPVERSIAPWKIEFDRRLRPYLSNEGDGAMTMLGQWPAEQLVRSGFPGDFGRPEDDPEWKAAVRRVLSPEQFRALDGIAGERERRMEREIAEFLKPHVEQARKARLAELTTEIEDMKAMLSLPGDRLQALTVRAEAAAGRAAEAVERSAAKALRAMPEQQRMAMMANGRNGFTDVEEDPGAEGGDSTRSLWDRAVAEILTEAERRRWDQAALERQQRAARAMAMLFIAEMDKRVQFSGVQRSRLEPAAVRAFAEKARNPGRGEVVNLLSAALFQEAEVKPLLDAAQWDRWQAAARGEYQGRYGGRRIQGAGIKEAPPVPAEGPELADDEEILAAYLERHTASRRADMAAVMAAKVEDVCRVARLPEAGVRHLRLAAKGAIEHALDHWRLQFDSWVRNSMNGIRGAALRRRLEGLEGGSISFGEEAAPSEQALWAAALAEVLSPEQKKTWDDEVLARKAYARGAVTWGILAEMNRRYHLTNAQFSRLEPLVLASVSEYFEDFTGMFGRGSGGVMPRYMIVLFAGVPETAAREILTPAQWEQWKENDFKQISNWWESMKNNRRWKNNRRE